MESYGLPDGFPGDRCRCVRCQRLFGPDEWYQLALCPDCEAAEEAERYGEEIGDFGEGESDA